MSFSIITVTLNSADTLSDTLRSVAKQKNVVVQHIIKDGGSTDGTVCLAKKREPYVQIIEQRDTGIYDAMNQGFAHAKNEYVGFLNSDDYLSYDYALNDIQELFVKEESDVVYGDIEIIDQNKRVIRYWRTGHLTNGRLVGMQIPHPAFFVRREVLLRLEPPFDPKYKIASDFKQQIQLINGMEASVSYLQKTVVTMRSGGASSADLGAIILGWKECMQAYREATNKSGAGFVTSKVIRKVTQFRSRL